MCKSCVRLHSKQWCKSFGRLQAILRDLCQCCGRHQAINAIICGPTQPPPASSDSDVVAEPNLVQVLVGLGLLKVLHHLESLVILQVHHVGSVFLPKCLELKLAFLALGVDD